MTQPRDDHGELRERLQVAVGSAYVLEHALGTGGFAVVFAATEPALGRAVALKVLRPELAALGDTRARFRHEAEAAARLRHPHVIPIYAVGERDGLAWLVMPLIPGESLGARLDREGRLPPSEARRILAECATALAAAHRAGILHRDIKPDNILLDGSERRVLLTDFGIAKGLHQDPVAGRLTATGMVVGTPLYMSPEQASGERTLDRRSDLYSLGVVGYEMLTGRPPFRAESLGGLLVKQLTEEPMPIAVPGESPADLAETIMRCLCREPERRWASAEDLHHALEARPAEVPATPAAPLSADGAAAAPVRRFRRLLIGAGAAVLLGLVGDWLLGGVMLGPPVALVGVLVVAAGYGRLWRDGYGWRDVAGARRAAGDERAGEAGPYGVVVGLVQADRAAIVSALGRLSTGERALVGDVVREVDIGVARAVEVARHLADLERRLDPGPAELERRIAEAQAEPLSPGRGHRLAMLEQRLDGVRRLDQRREELETELEAATRRIALMRSTVERSAPAGGRALVEALRAIVRMRSDP